MMTGNPCGTRNGYYRMKWIEKEWLKYTDFCFFPIRGNVHASDISCSIVLYLFWNVSMLQSKNKHKIISKVFLVRPGSSGPIRAYQKQYSHKSMTNITFLADSPNCGNLFPYKCSLDYCAHEINWLQTLSIYPIFPSINKCNSLPADMSKMLTDWYTV